MCSICGAFTRTAECLHGLFDALDVMGICATASADNTSTQFDPFRYIGFERNAIFLATPTKMRTTMINFCSKGGYLII